MRLDGHHAAVHAVGQSLGALGDAAGGETIGDQQRGAGREAVHHAAIVVAAAAQHEVIVQPQGAGSGRQLAGVVEDEAVDAVVGVLVGGIQPLMDDEGLVEPVGLENRETQGPVLLETMGALHPVQDELALGLGALVVDAGAAQRQLVPDVLAGEGVKWRGHVKRAESGEGGRAAPGVTRSLPRGHDTVSTVGQVAVVPEVNGDRLDFGADGARFPSIAGPAHAGPRRYAGVRPSSTGWRNPGGTGL